MALLLKALSFFVFFSSSSAEFERQNIQVGSQKLKVEIAKTPYELQKGMMMRTSWGEIEGMLFIFEKIQKRSFWMKKTFLPLSIGFFDKNKTLIEIYDLKPSKSMTQKKYDSVTSQKAVKYALEVPKGWFDKNKVDKGQKLSID